MLKVTSWTEKNTILLFDPEYFYLCQSTYEFYIIVVRAFFLLLPISKKMYMIPNNFPSHETLRQKCRQKLPCPMSLWPALTPSNTLGFLKGNFPEDDRNWSQFWKQHSQWKFRVSCRLRVMGRKLLGEIIRDQWNSIELGNRIIADGGG